MNLDKKYLFQIVIISVVLGLSYNFLSGSIPFLKEKLEIEVVEEISTNKNEVELQGIRTAEAIKLFEDGITFIDARDQWDFAEGHIPNAINMPEYKFTPEDPNLSKLEKDALLVIYCGGNDCDVSIKLGKMMAELGYSNLYIYLGGWNEWTKAELPVEKNEEDN